MRGWLITAFEDGRTLRADMLVDFTLAPRPKRVRVVRKCFVADALTLAFHSGRVICRMVTKSLARVTFRQAAAQEGERAAAVTFSYAGTQKRPR